MAQPRSDTRQVGGDLTHKERSEYSRFGHWILCHLLGEEDVTTESACAQSVGAVATVVGLHERQLGRKPAAIAH